MPFSISEIGLGFVIPALAAALLAGLLSRVRTWDLCRRYAGSIALTVGFLLGYGLLKSGPWLPKEHWHWMPWAVLSAGLIGPIGLARGVTWLERTLLYGFVALIAGWFLVPDWPDLDPSRTIWIVGLVPAVAFQAFVINGASDRTGDRLTLAVLFCCATACSILMAMAGILRFAIVNFAFAGPVLGCLLVAHRTRAAVDQSTEQKPPHAAPPGNDLAGAGRGIGLVYATLLCGWPMIGRVQSWSEVPKASYLMIALSPISLAVGWIPAIARLSTTKRWIVQATLTIIILGIGLGLAVASEWDSGSE